MLALAGICYGAAYAAIPVQKHDTTRMGTKKKVTKTKAKKAVRKDTAIKDTANKI